MEQLQEVLTVYFISSKKVSCNKYDHHRAIPYISSTQFIQMSYYVMIIVLFVCCPFFMQVTPEQIKSRRHVIIPPLPPPNSTTRQNATKNVYTTD